ncbi:MAG: hypothetical protein Q7T25_02120 [Sideroxyarcus sp.]|nr:hypothetical protein [Sideroxyarcus sp.]
MKTRLALFISTLLLLPFAGLLLSGGQWDELAVSGTASASLTPTVLTLLAVLCLTLLTNFWVTSRSGNNPFKLQRDYFLAMAAVGCGLGWLLSYLNHYAASWLAAGALDAPGIVMQSLLFALLVPAVLSTRALLGSFGNLLKHLSRTLSFPAPANDTTAFILAPLALLGLVGGAAWPAQLFWLLWAAPLLLLIALQLLWHESSIFSGVARGDWGRIVCAALSGLAVGNLAVFVFESAGGTLIMQLPNATFAQLGYVLFGLLCLQLGDIIAELWRGKTRAEVFPKKPFPISVVVKK